MKPFGTMPDGTDVSVFTLTNSSGVEARVTNYGGIILSLRVPDREGRLADIVLGYDNLQGYLNETPYFGAIIGRYGNRIANGRFELDGQLFTLDKNDGPNHLHGGLVGFDKVVWEAAPFATDDESGIIFSYRSPDGDEGYPGNLSVRVVYALTTANTLRFEYEAMTDKATPINLTQHSYFNLAASGDILGHELMVNAESITPIGSTLVPTGSIVPADGSPFDFGSPTRIGLRINSENEQLRFGGGYDHNFVLDRGDSSDDALVMAASVYEPTSGRTMEVWTTEPGLQFYSGNFLDGTITGKRGTVYEHRSGFCLETQHYPDSPNQPDFPSTILCPGDTYHTMTEYRFGSK